MPTDREPEGSTEPDTDDPVAYRAHMETLNLIERHMEEAKAAGVTDGTDFLASVLVGVAAGIIDCLWFGRREGKTEDDTRAAWAGLLENYLPQAVATELEA